MKTAEDKLEGHAPAAASPTPATARRRRTSVTLRDVASACGLSFKTVSRVLNNEPNVRDDKRERVLAAARELNYHPHMAARSLAARRNFLVGLLFENPSPNYIVDLQLGAVARLENEPYRMLALPIASYRAIEGKMVALVRSAGLDGVVLAPPISDAPSVLKELGDAGVPFARIASVHDDLPGPQIAIDDVAAAAEMTRHLIGLGHRRIAFVRGDQTHRSASARFEGFCSAMNEAGLAVDPALMRDGQFTFDSGKHAADELIALAERPTAIFASNDDMAAGCLIAAHEAGLSVPGDISIVGYDDSQAAKLVWPRLTTVRQPTFEMARAATDILLSMLESDEDRHDKISLDYELVIRASAGPAKG